MAKKFKCENKDCKREVNETGAYIGGKKVCQKCYKILKEEQRIQFNKDEQERKRTQKV